MWKKSLNKRRGLYNYVKLNPRISTNVEFKTRSVEIRDQATLPSFFFLLQLNAIAKMVITERKGAQDQDSVEEGHKFLFQLRVFKWVPFVV